MLRGGEHEDKGVIRNVGWRAVLVLRVERERRLPGGRACAHFVVPGLGARTRARVLRGVVLVLRAPARHLHGPRLLRVATQQSSPSALRMLQVCTALATRRRVDALTHGLSSVG